jgi:hypothetical protein
MLFPKFFGLQSSSCLLVASLGNPIRVRARRCIQVIAPGRPVWGNLFRSLDPHDPVKVNQRIQTLVDYVKTLQAN